MLTPTPPAALLLLLLLVYLQVTHWQRAQL
jgi:hypothetical protein